MGRGSADAFGYPLLLPAGTLYADLGADPEASEDEIRWAKDEATRKIQQDQERIEKELATVYAEVPELKEAYAKREALERGGREADEKQAVADLKRLAGLERRGLAVDADLRRKRERAAELGARIEALNRSALDQPSERLKHDEAHPPLALLKLADAASDGFLEGRTAVALLRRELSRFLAARGEAVFHPGDLTREDFSVDFEPHPLLDGGK